MVEQAKPTRSDPSPGGSEPERDEYKVAAAATSQAGDEDYETEPEVKVSEEALKGPKNPPARPEYDFEKEMDGKVDAKTSMFLTLLSYFF